MAAIHLMVGFMGFGKTTLAKELARKIPAVCLTHDEFMVRLYGRNIPCTDFRKNYENVDSILWELADKIISTGVDVIMDYGFWSHKDRNEAYEKAKKITDTVIFHNIDCDLNVAKQRIIERSQNNPNELNITEDEFNTLLMQYEKWGYLDDYPVVLHNQQNTDYIGNLVRVKIDRPLGCQHPKYGFEYTINYGFIPYTSSGDGEELDAYVLAIDEPLDEYVGRCIGVVHRINDDDDKLIVVPEALDLADEDIENNIAFQEQWFKHVLLRE